jgi:hypothetical protein
LGRAGSGASLARNSLQYRKPGKAVEIPIERNGIAASCGLALQSNQVIREVTPAAAIDPQRFAGFVVMLRNNQV